MEVFDIVCSTSTPHLAELDKNFGSEWGDAFRRLFRGAKIVDPERKLPKGWVAVQCHAAEAYQTNPMAEAMKKGTAAERSRAIALVVKRGQ